MVAVVLNREATVARTVQPIRVTTIRGEGIAALAIAMEEGGEAARLLADVLKV